MIRSKPKPLALTLGDPAGIGPEIIVKAWMALRQTGPVFMVVGDYDALAAVSQRGAAALRRVSAPNEAMDGFAAALPVLDLPMLSSVVAGQPSSRYAAAVIDAGFAFPGHTEFLAELTAGAD